MPLPRKLRFSRWRRLPGVHRITDHRLPDPREEAQPLTVYLAGSLLDRAEGLAIRTGAGTVQAYCERLLRDAIEAEAARDRLERAEQEHGHLEGLDAIANDPEYLAEWNARAAGRAGRVPRPEAPASVPTAREAASAPALPAPEAEPGEGSAVELAAPAIEVVFRHAGLGRDDPSGLLPTLRRAEPIGPAPAHELLQALMDLERRSRAAAALDRKLAYALHRLAFEGQVLLTDAWPGIADQGTIDVLRLVQESVDRILSGEDIRYYPRDTERAAGPDDGAGPRVAL